MFACGIRSACERLLEEDHGETKMAKMEERGHILIVKIILQNGVLLVWILCYFYSCRMLMCINSFYSATGKYVMPVK